MFFVAPNRQVSSLVHPGFLRIIMYDDQQKHSSVGRPSAFLQVCDWLYLLTADTPVLLANSGIFMFPAATPGSYMGIVLSSELPAALREKFQDLLSELTDLRFQAPVEGPESEIINLSETVPLGPTEDPAAHPVWSEKMSQRILSGALWLSHGFVKGGEATSRAIHKGAAKMRDHMTPEETPSEVSPRVHKGLHVAQQATGGTLQVSQFLVNGVSTLVGHVADKMAPHVKKQGAKLIPESMKKRNDGQPSKLDGVKLVMASSVKGFTTAWAGLEAGAKQVGKSVTSETVTTVTYKYGDEAGKATDTALRSVVNVGLTAYNIDNLGLKAILKTAGKETAKSMAKDEKEQTEEFQEEETEKQRQEEGEKKQ
ncbi:hypothetical protein LDENG_00095630 [Lucifuga dentata]|nr:hypothetical protein LDENG_00095630 [Lucifuga dentata]